MKVINISVPQKLAAYEAHPMTKLALLKMLKRVQSARPWWHWLVPFSYIRVMEENVAVMAMWVTELQVIDLMREMRNASDKANESAATSDEKNKSSGAAIH